MVTVPAPAGTHGGAAGRFGCRLVGGRSFAGIFAVGLRLGKQQFDFGGVAGWTHRAPLSACPGGNGTLPI